jgi:transposase
LSETRKYRKFSVQPKSELVLASLRGQKTIAEFCREHEISETLLRRWREQFLAAGAECLSARAERTERDELRRQVRQLERVLGRKTLEVEVAGELLRGWE